MKHVAMLVFFFKIFWKFWIKEKFFFQTFYIWEGVLATYRPENLAVCQLFKIMENEIFEIHVDFSTEFPDFSIEKIDSEGYWECVEIRGVLSTGAHFLCHSTSKSHAMSILKVS